ncbi:hypothetical protein FE257_004947 [Aspergillus nanangensis]|uniref:Uncharacterized protein n=1 Tax=Aspergillus nanangensis TaxID=2582783 RepID=A0AAD4CAI7_ASPNN|nr:hypothetical protein FE257_004947 [Aspergillus nanangensis]
MIQQRPNNALMSALYGVCDISNLRICATFQEQNRTRSNSLLNPPKGCSAHRTFTSSPESSSNLTSARQMPMLWGTEAFLSCGSILLKRLTCTPYVNNNRTPGTCSAFTAANRASVISYSLLISSPPSTLAADRNSATISTCPWNADYEFRMVYDAGTGRCPWTCCLGRMLGARQSICSFVYPTIDHVADDVQMASVGRQQNRMWPEVVKYARAFSPELGGCRAFSPFGPRYVLGQRGSSI